MYNGWSNHSTWSINLHMDETFAELADQLCHDLAVWDETENEYVCTRADRKQLAEICEATFYEVIDWDNLSEIVRDLMDVQQIDWEEIAQTHMDRALTNATETHEN